MALETWWLTAISLMNRNVGPKLRTERSGVEEEDPACAHTGAPVSSPTGQAHTVAGHTARLPGLGLDALLQQATPPGAALRTAGRLPRGLSLSHLGWGSCSPRPPPPALSCTLLFLQLLSPPSWSVLLSLYISISGNRMLHSHLA